MTNSAMIALPDSPDGEIEVAFDETDGGDAVHRFGEREINAINAAIAAGRPLLARGEPGIGKSQLARAAAKALGRAYVEHVVDSQTTSRDLLWRFDAIKRLADAQAAGALRSGPSRLTRQLSLAERNYIQPGPLWWAFDWTSARLQAKALNLPEPPQRDGGNWAHGAVVLIDEIDKAESEVPNGLLQALGAREFTPFGWRAPVRASSTAPLIVVTSNDERTLPDPFLRRCLVLNMTLPSDEALRDLLVSRGRAHFADLTEPVLLAAAEILVRDRRAATDARMRPWPGQAEYLDLLRAVRGIAKAEVAADNPDAEPTAEELEDRQIALIDVVARYTLKKNMGREAP